MLKILVVEDEGVLALALCDRLRFAGYAVCAPVATGARAIQSVQQEQPDMILMDIRLPGNLTGLETAQQIRAFSQMPIVFLSGYSNPAIRAQALELQPAAYLLKPAELADLEEVFQLLLPAAGALEDGTPEHDLPTG